MNYIVKKKKVFVKNNFITKVKPEFACRTIVRDVRGFSAVRGHTPIRFVI
jgi:hypothetical protein